MAYPTSLSAPVASVAPVVSVASVTCLSSPCLPWNITYGGQVGLWSSHHTIYISIHIYIYIWLYTYGYIYIYDLYMYIQSTCVYIYIYTYIYILFAWSPAMDIAPSYSLIGPRKPGGDSRINHLVQDVNPGWKSGSGTIQWGLSMGKGMIIYG